MEKWTIMPAPSPHDEHRHVLRIKGAMTDITRIIKRFGAMCGRPMKETTPEGYNFSLYLHQLDQAGWEKVSKALEEMAPGTAVRAQPASPLPIPTPPPVIQPPPMPVMQPPPVPVVQPPPPVLAPPPMPVMQPPPAPAPAPAPVVAAAPTWAPPAAAAPAPASPVSTRPLWGLVETIDEKRNFDSLSVGAYNRFAHAAAMSVVGAPGSMYNPLFIYGVPGVGKTHMLHAMAGALGKAMPGEAVLLTSGAALARAVSGAVSTGRLAEIAALAEKAKALVVDDIHLLALNELNQGPLSKLFNGFFGKNLQVILSSVYPPRALGSLEEALKISLAKGWSVDMKLPNPTIQADMIYAFSERAGITISVDDAKKFQEKVGAAYSDFPAWLRRFAALSKMRAAKGEPATSDDVLGILSNPGVPSNNVDMPAEADLAQCRGFIPPPPGPAAVNLAILVPKGQEALSPWLGYRFYETARTFGFAQTYRHVLVDVYDAEQPFGVPFQIGELCQRSGAQAALVLGPPQESKLAARSAEFSHAVGHILDSLRIVMGFVPHRSTMAWGAFLQAHLDCLEAGKP